MVTDAGFAIPKGLEVIDLSLKENVPTVMDVLNELKKYYSVEAMFMSEETRQVNPSHYKAVSTVWGDNIPVTEIPHAEMKEKSKGVKAVIRTGDFTSYGNVILVSGCGDRWRSEK